jgi:hypothetical protein
LNSLFVFQKLLNYLNILIFKGWVSNCEVRQVPQRKMLNVFLIADKWRPDAEKFKSQIWRENCDWVPLQGKSCTCFLLLLKFKSIKTSWRKQILFLLLFRAHFKNNRFETVWRPKKKYTIYIYILRKLKFQEICYIKVMNMY